MRRNLVAGLVSTLALAGTAQAAPLLTTQLWSTPAAAGFTSEIVAYDAVTGNLFLAAGGRVEARNRTTGALVGTFELPAGFTSASSVAVARGFLVVAADAANKVDPGAVVVFNAAAPGSAALRTIATGALPDMITFSPDGRRILVANEGEPNSYGQPGSVNPEGSITIIDASGANPAGWTAATAGFGAFNSQAAALRTQGVRIFGPGATVAQDLEPEYIALSADGRTAYVTLQENNALAIVDVESATVTGIRALGVKDHGLARNALDPSDRNGAAINIRTVQGLFGLYQPDAISSFTVGGRTWLATANEGDARDTDVAPGFNEVSRLADIRTTLNPAIFGANDTTSGTSTVANQLTSNIGRLNITTAFPGDLPASGVRDAVYAYGARSFSIWDDAGSLVWDSGSLIERTIRDLGLWADGRSDDKGPEPEAIEIATVNGRLYAFVGLERTHNVLAFDLTGLDLLNPDPDFAPLLAGNYRATGLERPEGLDLFYDVATGNTLLAVSYEGDGASTRGTALFLVAVPEPASLALFGAGLAGLGLAARRRRAQA